MAKNEISKYHKKRIMDAPPALNPHNDISDRYLYNTARRSCPG